MIGSLSVVLYLDLDGVLHPDAVYAVPGKGIELRGHPGHALFEHAPLLVSLLAPYPSVRIVLSTSWVAERGYSRTKRRLGTELAERVIGATYHSRHMQNHGSGQLCLPYFGLSRGRQVLNDVGRRRPAHWIALDDCDEGWQGYRRHLVLTDPVQGLGDRSSQEALRAALKSAVDDC